LSKGIDTSSLRDDCASEQERAPAGADPWTAALAGSLARGGSASFEADVKADSVTPASPSKGCLKLSDGPKGGSIRFRPWTGTLRRRKAKLCLADRPDQRQRTLWPLGVHHRFSTREVRHRGSSEISTNSSRYRLARNGPLQPRISEVDLVNPIHRIADCPVDASSRCRDPGCTDTARGAEYVRSGFTEPRDRRPWSSQRATSGRIRSGSPLGNCN
jgi:hypothetical protein